MKTKICPVLVLLLSSPLSLSGALEFCGFMSDGRAIRFVVADTETGVRSAWIAVGESFQNYTIVDFDSKSDALIVRNELRTLRLPLKTATIRDSAPMVTVTIGRDSIISVRDDPALLDALAVELRHAAELMPRAVVAIRASEKTAASFILSVAKLCRDAGLENISVSAR